MIDFYGFLGPWPYWHANFVNPEQVLSLMDRHRIETIAICSTRSIFWDWRQGNDETIAAAQKHPGRFVPFMSVSPILSNSDLGRYIEDYANRGVKGIRLHPQHQAYSLDGVSGAATILDTAGELGLPVVLPMRVIMNWGLPELAPATVESAVSKHSRVRFVLSGINYDLAPWAYDFMSRFPNVYLEISGMQGFRSVAEAVQRVGADKVLFGTGLPLLYPACSVEKVRTAKISVKQKEAISAGNARKLLGLT
jgi:uncharacterized protein